MAENNMNNRADDEILIGDEKETRLQARVKRNLQRANRKNGRFLNFFDLFVIFIVLVALALLILGVRISDIFGTANDGRPCRLEYQMRFSAVDETFAESVKIGDALYDVDTKAILGRVTAVKTTQSLTLSDGKVSALAEKVDIVVTVQVEAVYTEGVGYTVGTGALRIGSDKTLRFPGFVGTGECVALNELTTAK